MSTLTAKEIETFFLDIVKASPLATAVSGEGYRRDMRPRDSRLEDITVGFVSGMTDQIQTGVIAICVYVPDIDPYGNGVMSEDGRRTAQLERMAQDWIDSKPTRGTDYRIRLQDTITTVEDEPIHQHFVSIMLRYDLFNE